MRFAAILVIVCGFLVNAAGAKETWTLSAENSKISFVSIKAGEIGETNYFKSIEGQVSPSGKAEISVALDSVETRIDVRNERMRKYFFETEKFPKAVITADVDLSAYKKMAVGERKTGSVEVEVSLHGVDVPFEAAVFVTRLAKDSVLVETSEPLVLDANFFELGAGLKKLMELAGLPSISPAVPVTASLVFVSK